jgi:hypothetical protein
VGYRSLSPALPLHFMYDHCDVGLRGGGRCDLRRALSVGRVVGVEDRVLLLAEHQRFSSGHAIVPRSDHVANQATALASNTHASGCDKEKLNSSLSK